ncbi:MAG: SGNH/GDSL hydrolase family protein [Cyclobacteriaceae bacterium]|nr:SGNH/GDSL hydrolase family protein [Cyclobacteriaceae bacterium]
MKTVISFFCIIIAGLSGLNAQDNPLVWHDPVKSDFAVVEGQGWPDEVTEPYDRLPHWAEDKVREDVWWLSRQSAGLVIRFYTDAINIKVRYMVDGDQAMPHMPATGVSGVDLYAVDSDGDWKWLRGGWSFKDTITYHFNAITPNDSYHKMGREYRLFLPLYNKVNWLEIGVGKSDYFEFIPVRKDKPIVVYGTSIAQGGCASRPGNAWTSILSRKMDRPLINLAFSGNGRLEPEIIAMIGDIDAKVFILDCLPNLTPGRNFTKEDIMIRTRAAVEDLRIRHPTTPIVLAEHGGYTDGPLDVVRRRQYEGANEALRIVFNSLVLEGYSQLYLLPGEDFNLDFDTMVDGTHPNDIGMLRYAEGYEQFLRKVLNEPVGVFSTAKPVIQRREPANYEWSERHNQILEYGQLNKPENIIIGNSIIHFWGGQPEGPKAVGKESWDKYLWKKTANYAYGWDRVENVLWRVYHDELDDVKPEKIIVLIGTNNLHLNTDEEIVAGLELLAKAVSYRQPQAELFFCAVLPRRDHEQRVATLNDKVRMALSLQEELKFVDVGVGLLGGNGKINEVLFYDGLHPNEAGYKILGQALGEVLK